MSTIDKMQSDLRIMSVEHSNQKARTSKRIASIVQYDLAIAIEMSKCDKWDIEPARMLAVLQRIKDKLENVND